MISFKKLKSKKWAFIFDDEVLAKQLYPMVSYAALNGGVVQFPVSGVSASDSESLCQLTKRVERERERGKLSLFPNLRLANPDDKHYYARSLEGLSPEKQASELISILMAEGNLKSTAQLRPFYTDVERTLRVELSRIHKERVLKINVSERGKPPFRKMDTLLMLVDVDGLYSYVKQYKFEEK